MPKLCDRLPKFLLPAALILLAIITNPASASGGKPPKDNPPVWMGTTHLPVSYQGTTFSAMPQTDEVAAMTAEVRQRYPRSFFRVGWFEGGTHQFLDSLLPGVRFVSTYESYPFDFGKWHHSALVDGKLYDLYLLEVREHV